MTTNTKMSCNKISMTKMTCGEWSKPNKSLPPLFNLVSNVLTFGCVSHNRLEQWIVKSEI